MLLQFAVENYRSFRDRAVLSMLADPRMAHEPGQVLEGPGGRKVLRAAAVYGANGSGKSNLVKALASVQHMVLTDTRGDHGLPIVPFKLDRARPEVPAHFEIELAVEGKHYSYGFEATARQITAEWLHEVEPGGEERLLFEREAGDKVPRITIGDAVGGDLKRRTFMEFVAEGTRQNQLFLAEAGERNVGELEHVRKAIGGWTIVPPDAPHMPLVDQFQANGALRRTIGSVLKEGGTGVDDLRVRVETAPLEDMPPGLVDAMKSTADSPLAVGIAHGFAQIGAKWRVDEQGRGELTTLLGVHRLPDGETIEMSFTEESDGTRRLLNLAPVLHFMTEPGLDALCAIDELERSLHPSLTRMILQLFFARAGSGAAAQLVFTTHDTNLLNRSILSRDSIWLMEKDARGGSVLYPLSDLDQAQVDEVEKQGKGLEKGYLQGRFGAIPFFGSLESLGFRKDLLK